MRKAVAAFVLIVSAALLAPTASAQRRAMLGEGLASCGQWTQARQANDPKVGRMAQWVAGFLSGLNTEATGKDFLVGTDFDAVMGWVDNYCRAQPLDPLVTAAAKLRNELQSRAK